MGSGWTVTEQPCRACFRVPVSETFICEPCMDQLHGDLYAIPDIARELETEASRQVKKGRSPGVSTSRTEQPLPYNPAASDCLHELKTALVDAVFIVTIGQKDNLPGDTITALCDWLTRHEQAIALRTDGGQIVTNLASLIKRAQRVIDNPPDRIYIGNCVCSDRNGQHPRLYARAGDPTHRCRECGYLHDAAAKYDHLRESLADYGLTQREIESMLSHIPRPTLARWIKGDEKRGQRAKLVSIGTTAEGVPTYRYGDVLALDAQRQVRRAG